LVDRRDETQVAELDALEPAPVQQVDDDRTMPAAIPARKSAFRNVTAYTPSTQLAALVEIGQERPVERRRRRHRHVVDHLLAAAARQIAHPGLDPLLVFLLHEPRLTADFLLGFEIDEPRFVPEIEAALEIVETRGRR
jgi:hypothetical protein